MKQHRIADAQLRNGGEPGLLRHNRMNSGTWRVSFLCKLMESIEPEQQSIILRTQNREEVSGAGKNDSQKHISSRWLTHRCFCVCGIQSPGRLYWAEIVEKA